MKGHGETFSCTYSADQQEEIKNICQKYMPREDDKMECLRRLDATAVYPGKVIAIAVGIISVLLFGIGMCCTMVWTDYFILGIVIGVIGLLGMGASFPIYTAITKARRAKIAPEILRLSQALLWKP